MEIIDHHLKFGPNHSPRGNLPHIVLHHSAGHATVEEMHDYHKNVNKWAGIGYHLIVDEQGRVHRGRPEDWMGAHTSGHNECIGICAIGNFEVEQMPKAQQEGVVQAIRYIRKKYGLGRIYRHRDFDATACPGKNFPFKDIVDAATAPEPVTPPPAPAPKEKRYDRLEDCPGYSKSCIAKLLHRGYLKGREGGKLDLSEDMIRILCILDNTGVFGGAENE